MFFLKSNVRFSINCSRLRPQHRENTGSRPITEVKLGCARLVLGWETAWEPRVLQPFLISLLALSETFLEKYFQSRDRQHTTGVPHNCQQFIHFFTCFVEKYPINRFCILLKLSFDLHTEAESYKCGKNDRFSRELISQQQLMLTFLKKFVERIYNTNEQGKTWGVYLKHTVNFLMKHLRL